MISWYSLFFLIFSYGDTGYNHPECVVMEEIVLFCCVLLPVGVHWVAGVLDAAQAELHNLRDAAWQWSTGGSKRFALPSVGCEWSGASVGCSRPRLHEAAGRRSLTGSPTPPPADCTPLVTLWPSAVTLGRASALDRTVWTGWASGWKRKMGRGRRRRGWSKWMEGP